MAKILIKFPTRARRRVFTDTFNLYYSMLSGKHDYEFRISMDVDDTEMNNQEVWDLLDSKKNVCFCYGQNTCKIGAINANMTDAEFDVLLLASDDMIPKVQGYDDIIISKMLEFYPEWDGALHFNDGRAGQSLCTLSIMGRKLFDRFGYIYHNQYQSLWCDNEFSEVCHAWNKMTYIDQIIISHSWIDITGADSLHKRNESLFERDKKVFEARKAAGFPKEDVPFAGHRIENHRRNRIIDRRR